MAAFHDVTCSFCVLAAVKKGKLAELASCKDTSQSPEVCVLALELALITPEAANSLFAAALHS